MHYRLLEPADIIAKTNERLEESIKDELDFLSRQVLQIHGAYCIGICTLSQVTKTYFHPR